MTPVPPAPTPSVPEIVGVNVCVFPAPIMLSPRVRPLKEDVVVASVCVPPDCNCPAGPMLVIPEPLVASVVPSKVRPEPTTSDLRALVPLPTKMPPRVVLAVPPYATPSALVRLSVLMEAVPVAVRFASERLPEKRPLPWTERVEPGVVVPMPTFPVVPA